ncbi:MAG: ketosteroid isomerase family protein [Cyanobacteria bacterium P01_F01_bin.86]
MTLTLENTPQLVQTPTVEHYFQTFNQGDFLKTSQLFAATGQLLPPFEDPIVGQSAIHLYLEREASNMQAMPQEVSVQTWVGDRQQITVKGSVKALVFKVNAAWIFELDPQGKIEQVEVKLLASLQELLTLRPA